MIVVLFLHVAEDALIREVDAGSQTILQTR
jgi:hypothetical protein